MFNSTEIVIDAFVARLEAAYTRNYGSLERRLGEIRNHLSAGGLHQVRQRVLGQERASGAQTDERA